MTDKEKIEKFNALEHLNKTAGGWFGSADFIFAGHPFDEGRAKDARKLAKVNNVSLKEIIDIGILYLIRNSCCKEHIDEQIKRMNKIFSTKLS